MQLSGAVRRVRGLAWPAWRDVAERLVAAERGRFLLVVPVLMGVGDLMYFAWPSEPRQWLGCLFLALLAGLAALRRSIVVRVPVLAASAVALGFAAGQFAAWQAPPAAALPTRAAIITGTVDLVEALPEGRRIGLVQVSLAPDAPLLQRSLRIRLRADDAVPVETGDVVKIRVLARPPAPPSYPGAWDLQRDAWFSGIGGYGYALGPAEIIDQAAPGRFPAQVQKLRALIARRVGEAIDGPPGAIAATLLTGLAAAIPATDRAAFRDSGLAHLLAIAGLHVGIVMGLVFFYVRLGLALSERAALTLPIKQIAGVAALLAGGLYMVVTGMHVPIMRSFAMAAVVTLGLLSGRRAVSLRGLLLAAALLILVAPEEIVGVSFQMSFSAVLALIIGYEAMRPVLTRLHGAGTWRRRLAVHVAGLALTSLLAGTASAPFAAYHFGHFQLYFIFANMVAVPLTAFWVMPAGLLALALMPLGWAAPALVVMGWGVQAVLAVAHAVAAWPEATIAVPHMPDWGLAVTAIGLAWLGIWRSRLRLLGIPAVMIGLASPLVARPPDILVSPDGRLIALRTADGVFADSAAGASRFVRESWEQYWAAERFRPLADGAASGAVTCAGAACVLRARPGGGTALLLHGGDAAESCDHEVLISAEPIRRPCAAVPMVDRFTVWRDGAQAIWLDSAGARIVSDRELRGSRPWVALGPQQKAATLLPMAPVFPLP